MGSVLYTNMPVFKPFYEDLNKRRMPYEMDLKAIMEHVLRFGLADVQKKPEALEGWPPRLALLNRERSDYRKIEIYLRLAEELDGVRKRYHMTRASLGELCMVHGLKHLDAHPAKLATCSRTLRYLPGRCMPRRTIGERIAACGTPKASACVSEKEVHRL